MAWIPDWGPQIGAIAFGQPIDTVLHVGMCEDEALDTLISAQAQRVVLVEADPDRAAVLTRRTAHHAHVDVIGAALGEQVDKATFLRLSLPEFSGLEMPEELMTLYPGLRIKARLETTVLDVPALLQKARIAPPRAGATHLLILDSPVAASKHATLFLDASAQERFDRILIQASRDGMGGLPAKALLSRFVESGFLTENVAHPDPDFIRTGLVYPARLRKAEAAAAGLDKMQARLEDLQQKNAALAETAERTSQDLHGAKQTAAKVPEMQARLEDLQQKNAALAETAERTSQDLHGAKQTAAKVPEMQARLEDLQQKNAALAETAERTSQDLHGAKQTAAKVPEMQARLEDLQQKNAALAETTERTSQDLRLALRMQAMLERDIAELRDQFSALQDAKDRQDALLSRMVSPLGRALELARKTPSPKRKKS